MSKSCTRTIARCPICACARSSQALRSGFAAEFRGKVPAVSKPALSSTLIERLRDPGFTPKLREVDALVDLLVEDEHAKAAVRAIARVGTIALGPLREKFEASKPPLRAHIVNAIGRFA